MDQSQQQGLNQLSDDIQTLITAKKDDECFYKTDCHNEAIYRITMHTGVREQDKYDVLVCAECLSEALKEGKDWCYNPLKELLPGKKEILPIKRRGAPKKL